MKGEDTAPRPSYMAWIPSEVRYDSDLKPNAKLLYGEITALANAKGYCWAQNSYFAKLFCLDKATVSRLISQLAEKNYIRVDVVKASAANNEKRRIYVGLFDREGIDEKINTPQQKSQGGYDEKVKVLNRKNNTRRIDTPAIPKAVAEVFAQYCGEDMALSSALSDFLIMRIKKRKPLQTVRAAALLTGKLDRLSGGRRCAKIAMLDNAVLHSWDSVYPLKADELAELGSDGGAVVEEEGVRFIE